MHRHPGVAPTPSAPLADPVGDQDVEAERDRRRRTEAAVYAIDRIGDDPLIGDIFAAHVEGEIWSVRTWEQAVATAEREAGAAGLAIIENLRRAYQAARRRQCAAELADAAENLRRAAEQAGIGDEDRRMVLLDAAACEAVALEELDHAAALEARVDETDPTRALSLEGHIRHHERRARVRLQDFPSAERRGAVFSRSHPWLTQRAPRTIVRTSRRARECGRGRRSARTRSARSGSRGDPDPAEPEPPRGRPKRHAACSAEAVQ